MTEDKNHCGLQTGNFFFFNKDLVYKLCVFNIF